MNFNELKQGIQTLSDSFRQNAALAVNTHLTVRNWLIGFYIVEFEQNGDDRAKYGAKLLQNLADGFNEDGLSYRNLNLYRKFYNAYPQVSVFVPGFMQKHFGSIGQTPIAQLQIPESHSNAIMQTPSAQLVRPQESPKSIPADKLLSRLSFSHITLLLPIEDPLKRLFYEIETIKGTWSVRELKRQINSLYYERSGMSRNPALLSEITQMSVEPGNMLDTIKSPFTFEFLGLKAKDVVYESDLEQALIEHLEDFLMELGHGMCFEARQKRLIIGGEYYFVDLVFYSRILKCHVLCELKVSGFSHEHIGQLKTYVNYYRKEVMRPDDNPPVGILLVTDKNQALVEYAMADSDRDIFVSKYMLELPTQEQLIRFVNEEVTKL
ncbi:MAG: PDDEXK nuclease domain-containing protein [Alistipes sp.]|jgi:predicted nuclease of restriction endonuclease-like (RecB) superfamily|nr:PDDEXK nuclease domain-containing protein [Alistipes sp.]